MNNLTTFNFDGQTVSARELHKMLEATERFSVWMSRYNELLNEYELTPVSKLTEVNNNGGIQMMELIDYDLPIDLAKHICLMSRTEKGKQVREYLIQLEKAWNTPELVIARGLQASQKLLAEAQEKVKMLEADNEMMKPKALFADCVSASESTILIGELAKIIKANGVDIGQNRLFAWLRDNKYLIKRQGTDYNMPTQKSMELGLFKIKETTINKPDGSIAISKTVKVTGKGQQYFINKFLGENYEMAY